MKNFQWKNKDNWKKVFSISKVPGAIGDKPMSDLISILNYWEWVHWQKQNATLKKITIKQSYTQRDLQKQCIKYSNQILYQLTTLKLWSNIQVKDFEF